MIDNYLFAEPLLIEKLKTSITQLVDVTNAASLASLTNENPTTPCAYVIYLGDSVNADVSATGGTLRQAQTVTQNWAVVLCVYITDGRGLGGGSSEMAGSLINQIFNALCGEVLSPYCKPLTRHVTPVITDYDEQGYAYYQLNFQLSFINKYKAL